jgi:hypothetical protein
MGLCGECEHVLANSFKSKIILFDKFALLLGVRFSSDASIEVQAEVTLRLTVSQSVSQYVGVLRPL